MYPTASAKALARNHPAITADRTNAERPHRPTQKLDTHMTPVGLEPTQLATVELEFTPLDHSGEVS